MTDQPMFQEHELREIAHEERSKYEASVKARIEKEVAKRDTVAREAKVKALKAEGERLGERLLLYQGNPRKYRTQRVELVKQLEDIDFQIGEVSRGA